MKGEAVSVVVLHMFVKLKTVFAISMLENGALSVLGPNGRGHTMYHSQNPDLPQLSRSLKTFCRRNWMLRFVAMLSHLPCGLRQNIDPLYGRGLTLHVDRVVQSALHLLGKSEDSAQRTQRAFRHQCVGRPQRNSNLCF